MPSVQVSTRSDSQSVAQAGQVRVKVFVSLPVETSHSHAPETNGGSTQTVGANVVGEVVVKVVDSVVDAVVVDFVVDPVVRVVADVDSVVGDVD